LGIEKLSAGAYAERDRTFFRMLGSYSPRMRSAGNACTTLGNQKPVPLTSALMDSFTTWRDMRDPEKPGARYHASGCRFMVWQW